MKIQETQALLQLPNIQRWQIVEMTRKQSVAEHSFRVWVLALSIYDYLHPIPHNSLERNTVSHWALCHDVEEVFTGDMPANLKDLFKFFDPEICRKVANRVREENLPSMAAAYRGVAGTTPYYIVAIADLIEAMDFAWIYTRDSAKRDEVVAYLGVKLQEKYEAAVRSCPGIDWEKIRQWSLDNNLHHLTYFATLRTKEKVNE